MCMICHKIIMRERHEYKLPHSKSRTSKLEKNKRRYGNRE